MIDMTSKNWIVEGPTLSDPNLTGNRHMLRVAGFIQQVSVDGVPSCQERPDVWGIKIVNPYNLLALNPPTK